MRGTFCFHLQGINANIIVVVNTIKWVTDFLQKLTVAQIAKKKNSRLYLILTQINTDHVLTSRLFNLLTPSGFFTFHQV